MLLKSACSYNHDQPNKWMFFSSLCLCILNSWARGWASHWWLSVSRWRFSLWWVSSRWPCGRKESTAATWRSSATIRSSALPSCPSSYRTVTQYSARLLILAHAIFIRLIPRQHVCLPKVHALFFTHLSCNGLLIFLWWTGTIWFVTIVCLDPQLNLNDRLMRIPQRARRYLDEPQQHCQEHVWVIFHPNIKNKACL